MLPAVELGQAQVVMALPGELHLIAELAGFLVGLEARSIILEVRFRCRRQVDDARVALELAFDTRAGQPLELLLAFLEVGDGVERTAIGDHGPLAATPRVVERRFLERALRTVERGLEVREGDLVRGIRPHAELLDQEACCLRNHTHAIAQLVLELCERRRLAGVRAARDRDERERGTQHLVERFARPLTAESACKLGKRQIVDALRHVDRTLEPVRRIERLISALELDLRKMDALELIAQEIHLKAADLIALLAQSIRTASDQIARPLDADADLRLLARQPITILVRDDAVLLVDDAHAQADAGQGREITLLNVLGHQAVDEARILMAQKKPSLDLRLHLFSSCERASSLELGRRLLASQTSTMNNSPWIAQLKRTRPEDRLDGNKATDVAIIGGGIAGLSTAYYTLKNTKKSVILLEANLVAHGATGHNAGQVVTYFEKPVKEIVAEYGLDLAAHAQDAINTAWTDLEEVIRETSMSSTLYACTGYLGCSTGAQFASFLEDTFWLSKAGMKTDIHLVSHEAAEAWAEELKPYSKFFSVVSHKEILSLLETDDAQYKAAAAAQKGCLNSATFTEELAGFLLKNYPDRFQLFERSPVGVVELEEKGASLHSNGHHIDAKHIVLCTNGFEQITLINRYGQEIDSRFHAEIQGTIGYMSACLEPVDRPPTAISYFPKDTKKSEQGDVYFYLTRRPHEAEKRVQHNLVCLGGPEEILPENKTYNRNAAFPTKIAKSLQTFIRRTYQNAPEVGKEFDFYWHGLMGYTKTGLRIIGAEPCNPVLMYNLGCNGIGILPSIYGGKKIASMLAGKKQKPSVFDPKDLRCAI